MRHVIFVRGGNQGKVLVEGLDYELLACREVLVRGNAAAFGAKIPRSVRAYDVRCRDILPGISQLEWAVSPD
jgi:hypothetical protein